MTKEEVLARIKEIGIIPAIRLSAAEDALFAAAAVASGGIPIVEVTMTVPGGVKVIQELTRQNPEMIVGAGTLFDVDIAHRCLDAGALFLTSPGFDREIVEFGLKRKVAVMPGALTPTEVMMAWKAGSDFVKIFPCSQVGGPSYIKALAAPFAQVPLIAAGGVNQHTVADFIEAGAAAVGIGANLIQPDAIHSREPDWIRQLARRFAKLVRDARAVRDARGHGKT
jgi:2-dehydro-3-deoxyphosphogluconate aldolase/(4S)-4-hydroxy-2-oxoglutarate aldolase